LLKTNARPELSRLDLRDVLRLDETEFKWRFADTPLARLKWRGLRRNACVALGNVGEEACLPELEAAARAPDALVAEHARWAIGQIESRRRVS
jgi:epoxyqueuosine reductase